VYGSHVREPTQPGETTMNPQELATAERIKGNLLRGIYGNRSEVHTLVTRELSEYARHRFYHDKEVRAELADMPANAEEEREQDAANGFQAFAYRN
jgi:hypothetical protein